MMLLVKKESWEDKTTTSDTSDISGEDKRRRQFELIAAVYHVNTSASDFVRQQISYWRCPVGKHCLDKSYHIVPIAIRCIISFPRFLWHPLVNSTLLNLVINIVECQYRAV